MGFVQDSLLRKNALFLKLDSYAYDFQVYTSMELDIGLSDHMLRDDAIFLIISYNKVYDVFWCASKVFLDTYKQLNLKSQSLGFHVSFITAAGPEQHCVSCLLKIKV